MLKKIKQTNKFLVSGGLLFLFIAFLFVDVATAAKYEEKITPKERAVFAFFRAAGTAPDYDFWIKSNSIFKGMPEKHQSSYVLDETLRLGRGYSAYNEDEDLLVLTINVIAKYISTIDGEQPRIVFEFFQAEEAYVPTFSYPYGVDVVTLIISRLAAFAGVSLNEDQNNSLLSKIPYKDDYFDAKIVVHVRISSADTKKSMIVDDVKQWFMIGEIAYLKCEVAGFMGKDRLLWDYVAPWYKEMFEQKNMPEEAKYPHPYDLFKD
ncbi:MAG: hypothetical protein COB14_03420 [Alphaproteobacteria bacterium]|nr:MAG: hypothetical protein COB14_03420 [Alphaproteobacteria bacterium]